MPFAETAKFPTALAGVADLFNHKNFLLNMIIPTLASSMLVGDTSFTAVTGTGVRLPADNFVATIEGEIVFVGSRTGDVCSSVTRAYEGTVAAAHPAGAQINAFITARAHNQVAAEINAIETALGINLANVAPNSDAYILGIADATKLPSSIVNPTAYYGVDVAPASAGSLDDEFNGTVLNVSTRWTWFNQGGSSAALANSCLLLAIPTNSSNQILRGILQSTPATPWEVAMKISLNLLGGSGASNSIGLALNESGTGKYVSYGFGTGGGVLSISTNPWSNVTTIGAGTGSIQPYITSAYLKIKNDGANLIYSYSVDGVSYVVTNTRALNADFTTGPDHVGICMNNYATSFVLVSDWFRRTL